MARYTEGKFRAELNRLFYGSRYVWLGKLKWRLKNIWIHWKYGHLKQYRALMCICNKCLIERSEYRALGMFHLRSRSTEPEK